MSPALTWSAANCSDAQGLVCAPPCCRSTPLRPTQYSEACTSLDASVVTTAAVKTHLTLCRMDILASGSFGHCLRGSLRRFASQGRSRFIPDQAVITSRCNVSLPTVLGRSHEIIHLSCRYIMKVETIVRSGMIGQVLVETDHRVAQQHLLVPLGRTVGVEFHKEPVRATRDLHSGLEPGGQPLDARGLICLDAAVLNPRDQSPL